jgi:hypothetical protein
VRRSWECYDVLKCTGYGVLKAKLTVRVEKFSVQSVTGCITRTSTSSSRGDGFDTSTTALRVLEADEKGTQCLGVQRGQPVPGGYKYGDLALQVGEVSNLRQ